MTSSVNALKLWATRLQRPHSHLKVNKDHCRSFFASCSVVSNDCRVQNEYECVSSRLRGLVCIHKGICSLVQTTKRAITLGSLTGEELLHLGLLNVILTLMFPLYSWRREGPPGKGIKTQPMFSTEQKVQVQGHELQFVHLAYILQ